MPIPPSDQKSTIGILNDGINSSAYDSYPTARGTFTNWYLTLLIWVVSSWIDGASYPNQPPHTQAPVRGGAAHPYGGEPTGMQPPGVAEAKSQLRLAQHEGNNMVNRVDSGLPKWGAQAQESQLRWICGGPKVQWAIPFHPTLHPPWRRHQRVPDAQAGHPGRCLRVWRRPPRYKGSSDSLLSPRSPTTAGAGAAVASLRGVAEAEEREHERSSSWGSVFEGEVEYGRLQRNP
jgi:hypothetical protein